MRVTKVTITRLLLFSSIFIIPLHHDHFYNDVAVTMALAVAVAVAVVVAATTTPMAVTTVAVAVGMM